MNLATLFCTLCTERDPQEAKCSNPTSSQSKTHNLPICVWFKGNAASGGLTESELKA